MSLRAKERKKKREVDVAFQGGNSGGIDRSMAGNGKCCASGFLRPCFKLLYTSVDQTSKTDFTEITFYSQVRIKTVGYFLYRKIKLIMSLNMFRFWLNLETKAPSGH